MTEAVSKICLDCFFIWYVYRTQKCMLAFCRVSELRCLEYSVVDNMITVLI